MLWRRPQHALITLLLVPPISGDTPGGELAWRGGLRPLVRLERNAGVLLVRAMGLGIEERERAAAVASGKRARLVDFATTADEAEFGRVVRLSRQVAMLFLGHAFCQAVAVCGDALRTGSPIKLRGLTACVDELWYAYFVLGSSTAFEAIALDEGSDHDNLMAAIEKLSKLWSRFRMPMLIKVLLTVLAPILTLVLGPPFRLFGEMMRHTLVRTSAGRLVCHLSPALDAACFVK
jgi:hypothetical protein